MARVLYTAEAERHLDDIFDYIARENHRPAAAAKVLREINQKCHLYARFPFASQSRDDLGPGVRCFVAEGFVVICKPIDDDVIILAVLHGHQDIPAVFRNILSDG